MYRKLMFVMSFVVVLGLVSSASAGTIVWGGAVSSEWGTVGNWVGTGVPGSGDDAVINESDIYDAMITSASGMGGVNINNLWIGKEGVGALTVVNGGALTLPGTEGHGKIILGYGEGGSGTLTIRDGATVTTPEICIGSWSGGEGVLNMRGGYLHVTDWWFWLTAGWPGSTGHINLDGGLIETIGFGMNAECWGDPCPERDSGTMHITKGVLLIHHDASELIKKEAGRGTITGYNTVYTMTGWDEVLNNVAWKYDSDADTTTVWAIPEPATVLLLGLGGLALIRKKR